MVRIKNVVSAKDDTKDKSKKFINNTNSNLSLYRNQTIFCSFCRQVLADGSITFRGVAACPNCLAMWTELDANLREYKERQEANYGIK